MRITSNIKKKTVEKDAHMNCVPAYKCPQKKTEMHASRNTIVTYKYNTSVLLFKTTKQKNNNNNIFYIEYSIKKNI